MTRGVRYVNSRDTSVCNVKIVNNQNKYLWFPESSSISNVAYIPSFSSNETVPIEKLSQCSLLDSPLYRLYSTIYDEVKIRGVQYQITLRKPPDLAADVGTAEVYTMLDRRFGNGESPRTPTNLATACVSAPISFTDYRVPIIRRYYSARDVIERVQYHDCTLVKRGNYVFDVAYEAVAMNPNFFSPCFFFCVKLPITFTQEHSIPISVRVVYYLTFRNPKGLNYDFPIPDEPQETTLEDHVEVPGEVPADVPDELPPEVSYKESVVT